MFHTAMDHFKYLAVHILRCGAHFPRFHFHGSIAVLDFFAVQIQIKTEDVKTHQTLGLM